MKKTHMPILIETDEDGCYIVSCPSLKGCHSYGKTIDEALKNIKEAIELCMEDTKPGDMNKFIGFREMEITSHG